MTDYEAYLFREFSHLTAIDSLSWQERAMADELKCRLTALGFTVEEDDAGKGRGTAGNLYGSLPGTLPGLPLLLSSHMDTVIPGIGKRAVLHEDGTITSDGTTVLGADDAAGLLEILEGVRLARASGRPMRSVEIIFPIAEELYCKGTERFDFSKVRAKECYVLDLSGPVGSAALRAPTILSFTAEIRGRASHAGFSPETGIHAIAAMSEAVGRIPQGRRGEDTTVNIGLISGGSATNIVPGACICRGEIRSYVHAKALACMEEIREAMLAAARHYGAEAEVTAEENVRAYEIPADAPVIRRFKRACGEIGITPKLTETFGGSDNNVFALHGIRGAVISCGMTGAHGTEESVHISDLEKGARLVAALLTREEEGPA